MISPNRVKAVLLQEYFVTINSLEIFFDVLVLSLVSLLIFGFLSVYLAGNQSSQVAHYLLIGMLLWEIVRITQYSITTGCLWNVWYRNLSNMFVSPMNAREYLLAFTLSGIVKSVIVFSLCSFISIFVFKFNILHMQLVPLVLCIINLIMFGFAAGIVLTGLIFRYGTKIQAFAWGMIPALEPLTAAFFPVQVLPEPLRSIAYFFPATYVFEMARYAYNSNGVVEWDLVTKAFILNIIFCVLGWKIFMYLFNTSRKTGQFARNES